MAAELKECLLCHRMLPADRDHFPWGRASLSSRCHECKYELVKKWRQGNKDKVNAQARRRRERAPDRQREAAVRYRMHNLERVRAADAAAQRQRRAADPEGQRRRMEAFKRRREEERIALAGRPRPTVCELCGAEAKTVFDHCHETDRFRGWLCDRCNRVLGSVGDSVELLRRMIAYLEDAGGQAHSSRQEEDKDFQLRNT